MRQTFGAEYQTIPDTIWKFGDGRRFHIGPDYAYWTIYMGVGHEPHISSIVRRLVRPGDTAVDVGANFGWYTTLLAQAVSGSGRVFSFEPVPSTYQRLIEHLELNRLQTQVTAVRAAVSDTPGIAAVYVFKDLSHGCASLSQLDATEYTIEHAPVIRLDQYLRERGVQSVDFLKCDAEGSELPALKGCGEFLQAPHAPLVLVEVNEETSRGFGYSKDEIWRYLIDVGYDHFFEIASERKLRRIRRIQDVREANLLCAKAAKVKQRLVPNDILIDE